jgi:hypothetical protein
MFDKIKSIFRKRKIGKFISDVPTGLLPMSEIKTVNVVVDVEEPGFDVLREQILDWGRKAGVKLNIYFFDFRKLDKTELLITSIQTTIIKKELDWIGTPDMSKVIGLLGEKSDLFISMIENGDFPIEFISKCAKARFKIGRCDFPGHAYDMVISGSQTADLRSDSCRIFDGIVEYLNKIG